MTLAEGVWAKKPNKPSSMGQVLSQAHQLLIPNGDPKDPKIMLKVLCL